MHILHLMRKTYKTHTQMSEGKNTRNSFTAEQFGEEQIKNSQ